jgi:hypothetical protein
MPYQIYVRERGADRETLACSVGSNPEVIADGFRQKQLRLKIGNRIAYVRRYDHVEIREIELGVTPPTTVPLDPPGAA